MRASIIDLPVDEMVVRYEAGESTHALARAYGVCQDTAWRRLIVAGVKMRPVGAQLRNKNGLGNTGKPGGPLYTDKGYLCTHDREGKRRYIHRAYWEVRRAPIPEGYVVHHVNSNPLDNAIGNLAIMTQSEHARLHATSSLREADTSRFRRQT